MAQTFGVDPDAHLETTVQKLLEDPITSVEPLVKGIGAAALNGKARTDLCRPLSALMSKYPFNPRGPDASLDEVNNILKPVDGLLWKFYEASLKNLLPKQGSQYVAVPGGGVTLTTAFVMFFNRAATFSQMLYANGPNPVIKYSLKPVSSEASQDASITIDGQTISFKGSPALKQFAWPGSQQGAIGTAKLGGTDIWGESDPGLWGVFKFFAKGQRHPGTGVNEWTLVAGVSGSGQVKKIGTIQVEVDPPTFPPAFPVLGCPAEAAK
jgi:type VI secretion system protein ImpL